MPALGEAGVSVMLRMAALLAASFTAAAATVPVNFTTLTFPNDFLYSKSDFISSDMNQFYFPLTKCSLMNEKILRSNYPQIQNQDYLDLTDNFVATLRGFRTANETSKVQYLSAMGDVLASKSELLSANASSWSEFFTGSLSKNQIEALPAAWQYLTTEQVFKSLGGADCADIVNSRPTSLGLLLKMVAIMRDQPDTFKAEFLNNLADLNDLATEELQYMLAYRWLPAFNVLGLNSLLNLPADAVMSITSSQFDQMNIMDRLKNAKVWNTAAPWSMTAWFQLVNNLKGFESMAGPGNISMYGHLLTGAPVSKIRGLVVSRKLDSFSLAALIRNPAMDSLKVQELWAGLSDSDQVRVFPTVGVKLGPRQLRSYLQRTKADVSTLGWLDGDSELPWASLKVAGRLRLASLPENYTTWTASDLMKLGNLSIILSPRTLQSLDPKSFTRPVLDSILSSRMSTGQLKAIYDQYIKLDRGVGSSLPPLLLSFLAPDVLAGAGVANMVASDRGLKNLLIAANRFVPSQTRALYELVESQLWSPSNLGSVLLYYPDLLNFTPVREFKTRIPQIRAAVSLAGEVNFPDIVDNIKTLPRRLLTAWLEQVFSVTNRTGMWATSILLDLPTNRQPPGGGPSYAILFSQGDSSSLLPSLALTGLSCQLIEKIAVEDTLEVLAVYRAQLRDSGYTMPSSLRKCWARKVRQFLFLKSTLFNVTILHEVELLSLLSTADIRAVGADVLLTWGGRILTGITHPQVMLESLIAVAQESPALYLNNGVWQSDMTTMADTLYLALKSPTGSPDLGVLTKMRDLVPYLSSKYLSTFKQDDIQMFVRSVLRSSRYSRTICTTAEGRRNFRDFILQGLASPANWSSGDLVDLGDLLVVLTPDDFKQINSSSLKRAVPQLVKDSWFTTRLPEIRGRGRPLLYYEACAKWLSDENRTSDSEATQASSMKAAWRSLAQLHLIGSQLYAGDLEPTGETAVVPRRRRRQVADSTPSTLDLRTLHDQVMILVKNMFSTGKLSAAQQQAAIQIVSNSQEMLGNQSLVILGYDPAKVNMNQTQVLGLLASSKAANNMTATQSAQISQLASDTQVRIIQSLVKLLGLTPTQLGLTQANFTTVMALPTFVGFSLTTPATATTVVTVPVSTVTSTPVPTSRSSSTTAQQSSTALPSVVIINSKTSSSPLPQSTTSTTTTLGFLPSDVKDPSIFQYDDVPEVVVVPSSGSNATTTRPAGITGKWGLVAGSLGVIVNSTTVASGGPATSDLSVSPPPMLGVGSSPLLGPLPDFESLKLTCDSLRLAGPSASVIDSAGMKRITDNELLDCLEVLGQLDFEPASLDYIALNTLGRYNDSRQQPPGSLLRGNIMVMLGNLLPSIASGLPTVVDTNFMTNYDGLGVLGQKSPVIYGNASFETSVSSLSASESRLINQYVAANLGGQLRALSAVEVAGLGQLLCQLNATQWSTLVPEKLAVGVMEAVLASLSCTLTDDVRSQVGRLATAGYGLSSATWMASDLMGLGWLLPSLHNDTLAGILPPAMDGMCGEAASSLGQVGGLTAGQLELLSPHAASMLARPLATSAYLDPAKRRAIRAAGGESAELLRVLDQLELNFKLLDENEKLPSPTTGKSSGPGRPAQLSLVLHLALLYTFVYIL